VKQLRIQAFENGQIIEAVKRIQSWPEMRGVSRFIDGWDSVGEAAATFALSMPDGLAKLSFSFCTKESESSDTCFSLRATRRFQPIGEA